MRLTTAAIQLRYTTLVRADATVSGWCAVGLAKSTIAPQASGPYAQDRHNKQV